MEGDHEAPEIPEGRRARQGRASLLRDQAAVWVSESALPRTGEERRASDDVIRAIPSVDGAASLVGDGVT